MKTQMYNGDYKEKKVYFDGLVFFLRDGYIIEGLLSRNRANKEYYGEK